MTTMKFNNLTARQIKAKQAAFYELFGQDPVIYVRGIFTDTQGNAVFLQSSRAQIAGIGKKNLVLWIHSDSEKINVRTPLTGAEYEFSHAFRV